jgi:hypothetical protein
VNGVEFGTDLAAASSAKLLTISISPKSADMGGHSWAARTC